jgi:hypothetical protein
MIAMLLSFLSSFGVKLLLGAFNSWQADRARVEAGKLEEQNAALNRRVEATTAAGEIRHEVDTGTFDSAVDRL